VSGVEAVFGKGDPMWEGFYPDHWAGKVVRSEAPTAGSRRRSVSVSRRAA
jgi:hypothetical protein